jgi:hypothetical protein
MGGQGCVGASTPACPTSANCSDVNSVQQKCAGKTESDDLWEAKGKLGRSPGCEVSSRRLDQDRKDGDCGDENEVMTWQQTKSALTSAWR